MSGFEIVLRGEKLILLPHKAVYWPEQSALFLADLHLGKARHFRKEGIGIPEAIGHNDYAKLFELLRSFPVGHVYFLGDLFHSVYNKEWSLVSNAVKAFCNISFHLVMGNHDILQIERYQSAGLNVHKHSVEIGPFSFVHEPPDSPDKESKFIFCGHLHPGVTIKGKGRQYVRLPCYYTNENYMILPAFGTFTGTKAISLKGSDVAYAVLNDKVVPIRENQLSRKKSRG